MFLRVANVLYMSACITVLLQFFSSLGALNAIELPLELLRESVNGAKSKDYARRMAFPLTASDSGVELPPAAEDNMDFATSDIEDTEDVPIENEMPKWLKMQIQQPELHQHNNYHRHSAAMLPKHKQPNKHQHDIRQLHTTSTTATSSPLRRCSIEISSKIPGICQVMGSIGNACVSGDYIDVFNAECL